MPISILGCLCIFLRKKLLKKNISHKYQNYLIYNFTEQRKHRLLTLSEIENFMCPQLQNYKYKDR